MTKSVIIPWELKYDWAMKIWASNHRGFLYALREKYGAIAALEIFKKVQRGGRVKTLTDTIRTVFNLEGKDAKTIGEVLDLWDEITGTDYVVVERSQIINRRKVTKCPFKTGYEDISAWSLTFFDLMGKTINPKAILERSKGMCAGDPYCEYIWKLEDSKSLKETVESRTKDVIISYKLKYDFALNAWISNHRGHLFAIRDKYGADAALEMYERFCRMGDRIKNLTKTILTIFKIEGNDAETWAQWWDIWKELNGSEFTWSERSKTMNRFIVTKCPWPMKFGNISDWHLTIFMRMVAKTINPKATVEQTKNMCAGDPYCEFIFRIKE